MIYTVYTGLITCAAWSICVITHLAMPHSYVAFGLFLATSDLYNVCLLASLNARSSYRKDTSDQGAIQMASFPRTPDMRPSDPEANEQKGRHVEILCELSESADIEDIYLKPSVATSFP
ncbi:hypothetical protein PsYK624_161610 [Phanerochaete sordida]|uniref:DUF6534 domain-containing protein n=1 Tax=Phanerochaete sordida TaxID=48140 RepID=A0A9P3GQF5_9APHY|nr:hypothetical protein PsYK624_161610 [Phanerochaete sordida]